jgi:hypothetical protein
MLIVHVYPIMEGLELWVAASCPRADDPHNEHGKAVSTTYIDRERLDKHGLEAVVGFELAALLTEYPEVARLASC